MSQFHSWTVPEALAASFAGLLPAALAPPEPLDPHAASAVTASTPIAPSAAVRRGSRRLPETRRR
jgi:hypothetical protein